MDMNIEQEKKISIKWLLLIIFLVLLVLVAGTYAWLNYRSKNTAMVLTIGELNDMQVTLSPYKIEGSLVPVSAYTDQTKYSTITVKNNNASSRALNLYYHINDIPQALRISGFKYTITKSTDGSTFTSVKTGNFSTATSNSDFVIHEDSVNNGTTYYRVYTWLDTNDGGNQSSVQSAVFNAELLSSILKYTVTFGPNGGTVDTTSKTVALGDTYGDLPIPTRSGYTFKGWNGKNKFDKSKPWLRAWFNKNYNNSIYFVSDGSTMYVIPCEGNKTYTISYDFNIANSIFRTAYVNANEISNKTVVYQFESTANRPHTLTTGSSATYIVIQVAGGVRDDVANTLQVEEGSEATAYEPYYITSNTEVVQKQNHTLKAVWEENN